MSAAATLVRKPPIRAPSSSRWTLPSRMTPTSVVVPPMSTTMASSSPDSLRAPLMLDAGPESIVSTGLSRAIFSLIMEPSPLTTRSGASMPDSSITASTESSSLPMMGMSLAFITQVVVRSLNPRDEDSSCPHTAGTPRMSEAMALTAFSWSGFLMLMNPVIATESTFPLTDSRNVLTASRSRGSSSRPEAL